MGERNRPHRPGHRFRGRLEWGLDQHERPRVDALPPEPLDSPAEPLGGRLLVESGIDPGIDGFQTQGHLQPRAWFPSLVPGCGTEEIAEPRDPLTDEGWVAFENHPVEGGDQPGKDRVVRRGDRPGIEERARIVELDLGGTGPPAPALFGLGEDLPELGWQIADGHRVRQGMAPEVAEDTPPRALPVGEEDGQTGHRHPPGAGLGLQTPPPRCPGVQAWPGAPQRRHPLAGWQDRAQDKSYRNSLYIASSNSCRPDSRLETSPSLSACFSQSASEAFPASMRAPMPESQER